MIGRLILFFGAGIFLCQFVHAQQAVPVDKERHHRVVLENGYIRVLDGRVAAGDTTPAHVHAANSVVVFLSRSSFGIRTAGKPPVIADVNPGDIRYTDYGDQPVTHIVWAQGGGDFHFYVVELVKRVSARDSCPVLARPGLSFQWRKPGVTAYYWDLPPGQQYRLPATSCASFLIDLAGTYPFQFYPPKAAITIRGHANAPARYLVLQIR